MCTENAHHSNVMHASILSEYDAHKRFRWGSQSHSWTKVDLCHTIFIDTLVVNGGEIMQFIFQLTSAFRARIFLLTMSKFIIIEPNESKRSATGKGSGEKKHWTNWYRTGKSNLFTIRIISNCKWIAEEVCESGLSSVEIHYPS